MDNFIILYKILKALEAAMDYDMIDLDAIRAERFGITRNRWQCLMKMLVDNGYVEGIQVYQPADGDVIINMGHPKITLKGLEYLEENSLMKKAYRLAKGIKDVTPGL